MTYLIDTSVLSEARKRWPDPGVAGFLSALRTEQTYVSVLSIGEIRAGIAKLAERGDTERASALEGWVDGLEAGYGDRILPVTLAVTARWAAIAAARTLPAIDSLIAATALAHGLTVVTRNVKDFEGVGVPCHDPFAGS